MNEWPYPSLLSSLVHTLLGTVVAEGNQLASNLTHSRRSTCCAFPSSPQETGSPGDRKRGFLFLASSPSPFAPAGPTGSWGASGPGRRVGAELRGGARRGRTDRRLARSRSPRLRKARVPRGRPGLRMGAGGGGTAQRDPGWKPCGAPRPGGGVCLFDCSGWRGAELRLLTAESASVSPRRRWALGRPRGRQPLRLPGR